MSSILSPYPSSPPIPSSLIRDPPDAIPPIDDLETLQAELKLLQQKAYERAKKAGNDLKAIEESMRRMKEKEKGKARAVDKARKARACACFRVRPPTPTLLDVYAACHDLTRYTERKWRRQSTIRLICTLCQGWLRCPAHGKWRLFIPVFARPQTIVSRSQSHPGGSGADTPISEYLMTKRRRRNGKETMGAILSLVGDCKSLLSGLYLRILQNPRRCGNPPPRCHNRYHHLTNHPRPQSRTHRRR